MKNLAHLLLVLTLISISSCGSKKNKTDGNDQLVCVGYSCPLPGVNTSSFSATTAPSLEAVLANPSNNYGFVTQRNSYERYDVGVTNSSSSSSWFNFSWSFGSSNSYDSEFTISSALNGTISNNNYGTSAAQIASSLGSEVSRATGFMAIGNKVFKVQEADGDIIFIDMNYPIGMNPVKIQKVNGNVEQVFRINTGF